MKLFYRSAIALFIVSGTTSAAFAEKVPLNPFETLEVKTAMVSFADLDLANPADASIMLDRIDSTARKVCRGSKSAFAIQEMKEERLCIAESYKSGIVAINAKKNVDIEAIAASTATGLEVVAAD